MILVCSIKPDRDLVLRDQKMLPEVRNRPLLPRDFSTIQPSKSLSYSSRGTSGFTHPTSVILIRPGWSLSRFRNLRLVCSELRIKTDVEIYGSSIGVCNYVIQSNPIQSVNQPINHTIKSNQLNSNQIPFHSIPIQSNPNQSIDQSINQSIT